VARGEPWLLSGEVFDRRVFIGLRYCCLRLSMSRAYCALFVGYRGWRFVGFAVFSQLVGDQDVGGLVDGACVAEACEAG